MDRFLNSSKLDNYPKWAIKTIMSKVLNDEPTITVVQVNMKQKREQKHLKTTSHVIKGIWL